MKDYVLKAIRLSACREGFSFNNRLISQRRDLKQHFKS